MYLQSTKFKDGYTNYGGSIPEKIARIFTIKFDPDQMKYVFQIDEGAGRITKPDFTSIRRVFNHKMLDIIFNIGALLIVAMMEIVEKFT